MNPVFPCPSGSRQREYLSTFINIPHCKQTQQRSLSSAKGLEPSSLTSPVWISGQSLAGGATAEIQTFSRNFPDFFQNFFQFFFPEFFRIFPIFFRIFPEFFHNFSNFFQNFPSIPKGQLGHEPCSATLPKAFPKNLQGCVGLNPT